MTIFAFVADTTIPGLSAKDLARRASDQIAAVSPKSSAQRRAFARYDREILRDVGLDRGAC